MAKLRARAEKVQDEPGTAYFTRKYRIAIKMMGYIKMTPKNHWGSQ